MMLRRLTIPGLRFLPALAALALAAPAPAAATTTTTAATVTTATTPRLAAAPPVRAARTQTSATRSGPADFAFTLAFKPADPRLKLSEIHIGDPLDLDLASRDGAVPPDRITGVEFDLNPEQWHIDAPFRRGMTGSPTRKAGEWLASVRPFEPGRIDIPPLKVNYRDAAGRPASAWTTTATLNVLALRPANAQDLTLLPMRDPSDLPRDWTWLWTTLASLAVVALLVWAGLNWWRRHQARALLPPEPELPPGLWALRELDYRSRLPVCAHGPAKPIFSHVSEVVRLYLGRRYAINAIDLTTHECLQALAPLHPGEQVLRWVREFLEECDMVKFTTFEPSRERWKTIWHDARLIVKMTTPPEELGEPAPADAARQEVAV